MKTPSTYKYLPPSLAERLRDQGITVRRPVEGQKEGLHRSPHFGSSVEFAEYREYTPGDPTHLIDWAVYARTDRYVIRRFHEETNLRAYVMLDTSESLSFREEGSMSKMDYASYLAAGLMFTLVNQGDSVGFMTFDEALRKTFAPVGTFDGLRGPLRSLEANRPSGRSDIEACLHEAAVLVKSKSLFILVSDLLESPSNILRGIRHLYHDGHNVLVLHVLDRGEMRLPYGGVADFRELETGKRLVVVLDEIRDAFRHEVERYLNELRMGCSECLADYYLMDTSASLEDAFNSLQVRFKA